MTPPSQTTARARTPFGSRRAKYCVIDHGEHFDDFDAFETYDAVYRSLCAALYNFAPSSGHPGGSISSGRFVTALLYDRMEYDFTRPDRNDNDIISYAAGHKALGLYAHWALRNEIMRIARPELLPADIRQQLRLEDLLGFRRNPTSDTPLFKGFEVKALDGHPTPATPFVQLATGASGVGMGSSIGLAFAAADLYGENAPVVHIIEGEGGMTPGRVSEAMAAAATASLGNIVLHIDWNQSSIDSDIVCRNGSPGDYVQWDPAEFAYLHDWNVILVEDGKDFEQIIAAQEQAAAFLNGQPTAIVYKTVKGWNYGIEGKASHGAGHSLCSAEFYNSIKPLIDLAGRDIELCTGQQRCRGGADAAIVEECMWKMLLVVRTALESNRDVTEALAERIVGSRSRLDGRGRLLRQNAPDSSLLFNEAQDAQDAPAGLKLTPGTSTTLRGELGKVLAHYNKVSGGAFMTAAADLLGSTSVSAIGKDFATGFFNTQLNLPSRTLSVGGICEDAMAGVASGLSTFGHHVGVCSSYGAFMAPLGHIAARLHAIGAQARRALSDRPYDPFVMICAHAGIKTGEDGPTHADPQPLQLLQENFPRGTMITLTPWDPQDLWPLVTEALRRRPAIIAPFVTRPSETVLDREELGLAPPSESRKGVYLLRPAKGSEPDATVVLQGSEAAYEFVTKALPLLEEKGLDVAAYYVASAELFDLLPAEEQAAIFPDSAAQTAMGITGFTLPTMYRWICSPLGRKYTLHPFRKGHYLGSGKAESVVAEAGLDGVNQFNTITAFIDERRSLK